ncbi:MAG TPA: acetate--CoA ligase, partial [Rudaea sp.]|nr:acetate--CoA ligase [Rudaea sp.]
MQKPLRWPTIGKTADAAAVPSNMTDYERARRDFDWSAAKRELAGLPGGRGVNIANECVDRHVAEGHGDRVALRWIANDGTAREFRYAELAALSNRFANALEGMNVRPGDCVFTVLGRVPELYIAALGTWKAGAVLCPLFSAFGPEPIRARMAIAAPSVLVTSEHFHQRKIAPIRHDLDSLKGVILVGDGSGGVEWNALLDSQSAQYEIDATDAEDLATLHFTSGTTGRPKGAMLVHGAVLSHRLTARFALDLRADDVFWCTADPGWVTGTSYGIVGPLSVGCTMLADEGEFDAERWYRILAEQRVSVWYTAPTAIRMLMRAGDDLPRRYDLSALRFIASVGEPLNPEAVVWGQRALGQPIHDNWWQTETGGIMIANYAATPIRPGSMGRPIPGVEAAVAKRNEYGDPVVTDGTLELVDSPDVEGQLVLKPGWPSMFRGYLHDDGRYRGCFVGGWYLTGDLVRKDADGYLWFIGRADDVIKSSGHLIGPFEVESALMEHPAVAEAGVIGIPDPIAGEVVKAFVGLRPPYEPTEELRLELIGFGRKRLGPAVAPREIEFATDLPKTRSGKVMRRLLKARELGLPEGDLSTLERG